jgi:hypothetical protein
MDFPPQAATAIEAIATTKVTKIEFKRIWVIESANTRNVGAVFNREIKCRG